MFKSRLICLCVRTLNSKFPSNDFNLVDKLNSKKMGKWSILTPTITVLPNTTQTNSQYQIQPQLSYYSKNYSNFLKTCINLH